MAGEIRFLQIGARIACRLPGRLPAQSLPGWCHVGMLHGAAGAVPDVSQPAQGVHLRFEWATPAFAGQTARQRSRICHSLEPHRRG
jgi:hypothetical protein